MFVRNFFTKATAEEMGYFAFFEGSVLGIEASFRVCFEWNDYFYIKTDEVLWNNPFLRVKCFPFNGGFFLREAEKYNPDSGVYEPVCLEEKDRAFLHHVIMTCNAVLLKARTEWCSRI